MHSILASLDEALIAILKGEGIDIGLILRFGLLHSTREDFLYFHSENKKNIRLFLESSYFVLLNSICRQNHTYLNEYAGELIMEKFLEIIWHE